MDIICKKICEPLQWWGSNLQQLMMWQQLSRWCVMHGTWIAKVMYGGWWLVGIKVEFGFHELTWWTKMTWIEDDYWIGLDKSVRLQSEDANEMEKKYYGKMESFLYWELYYEVKGKKNSINSHWCNYGVVPYCSPPRF